MPAFRSLRTWIIIYSLVALLSLLYLYGSLLNYWKNSIFSHTTLEILIEAGGSVLGYLANVGQRFWAFGVLLMGCWWQNKHGITKSYWKWAWLGLCLTGTLSSNRLT
ncbi:MAG: hypothetical protein R2822_26265 [Spirosomataceae bacterium]